MDIAGALSPDECMEELHLDAIRGKPWHITYIPRFTLEFCNDVLDQVMLSLEKALTMVLLGYAVMLAAEENKSGKGLNIAA